MHEAIAKMLLPLEFSVLVELSPSSERAAIAVALLPFEHAVNIPVATAYQITVNPVLGGNLSATATIRSGFG